MTCRTRFLSILLLASGLFFSPSASAYPEFISRGYSSCLTCHYNGNGGGPLNDYGRALWATEFASRFFYPKTMSEDTLAAQSGFLGTIAMPTWFRPQIDYRGLQLHTNPGSGSSDNSQYLQMQTDLSLVFQTPASKYVGVITYGHQVAPEQFGIDGSSLDHIIAREYYLRVEVARGWWVYAGLIEKVFGLRNIDHSSYQRAYQTFNMQNNTSDGIDKSQGLILQRTTPNWELTVNGFIGNPNDNPQSKQSGGSVMGEYTVAENKRLGLSLMTASSGVKNKQMAALHYRQQVGKDSALLFEYGLIQDTPSGSTLEVGSYNFLESTVQMVRGYKIITTIERYNSEFKAYSPDQWRFGFGFLMFPAQRFELRTEAINLRQFSSSGAPDDTCIRTHSGRARRWFHDRQHFEKAECGGA